MIRDNRVKIIFSRWDSEKSFPVNCAGKDFQISIAADSPL
jgi:hypothetical protein